MYAGWEWLPVVEFPPSTVTNLDHKSPIALYRSVRCYPAIEHIELVLLSLPIRCECEANGDRGVVVTLNDVEPNLVPPLIDQALYLHRTEFAFTRIGECLTESRAETDAGMLVIDRYRLRGSCMPLVIERLPTISFDPVAAHGQRLSAQKKLNPFPIHIPIATLECEYGFTLVAISKLEPHIIDHMRLVRNKWADSERTKAEQQEQLEHVRYNRDYAVRCDRWSILLIQPGIGSLNAPPSRDDAMMALSVVSLLHRNCASEDHSITDSLAGILLDHVLFR